MMQENRMGNTIADLLELAITSEQQCEQFYRELGRRFSNHEPLTAFWNLYAGEEAGHARWLENLRARLDGERLAQEVNADILAKAQKSVERTPEMLVADLATLEDAYQLASEIEHEETNAVFAFLITHFTEDPQTRDFLRAQLRDHVGKLSMQFPEQYRSPAVRVMVAIQAE
jgi:hypothetical protein